MLEYLEQQKKLTINQWKIFAAVTIGDMLDFFDFLLIAFVLAFIVKDWNLTYGESGAILLASGISAPLGSLFYGWLADKIGRRKVMIITILNFSIATGLMALTPEHGARQDVGGKSEPARGGRDEQGQQRGARMTAH